LLRKKRRKSREEDFLRYLFVETRCWSVHGNQPLPRLFSRRVRVILN
jgi:hypothetical protein